jgi:hypothetical protein
MRLKINHSSKAFYNTVDENGIKQHPLDRTTRYYVSNKGGGLTVYYNGSTEVTRINKGFVATLFNQYVQQDKYDINYRFYIEEAYKIHDAVVDYQLSLF